MARHDQQPWEQRRYWQGGAIVRVEWWYKHQPVPQDPEPPPDSVRKRDFCYRHGYPIYRSLGCQVCGQRPGQSRA